MARPAKAQDVDRPKIEEILSGESDDCGEETSPAVDSAAVGSDESPNAAADGDADDAAGKSGRHNRGEKKGRKAVQKLGMKLVPDVKQVRIKRNRQITFVISNPEVYKSPNAESYVIFGEAKIEDDQAMQSNLMAKMTAAAQSTEAAAAAAAPVPSAEAPTLELAGGVDVADDDVDLVLSQISCTKDMAVQALRVCNNDVVEAIIMLTK
eukprot:Lankesteria_metandrocarpae@DN3593_c0_g1_i1.p2